MLGCVGPSMLSYARPDENELAQLWDVADYFFFKSCFRHVVNTTLDRKFFFEGGERALQKWYNLVHAFEYD